MDAPVRWLGGPVHLGSDAFARALANVLDNALRHAPSEGTVDVARGQTADHAFVRVSDDGPGIAPDVLPQLFELAVRSVTGRGAGGTGLGLAIAARMIQNQGGTIEAPTHPRRGATLILRLPLNKAGAQCG